MLYKDFLETNDTCPFCDAKERMLKDNATTYLTYALAPYHKHHLLVVPKKHVDSLFALTSEQKEDIDKLLDTGMTVLRKLGYTNFTMIVREGNNEGKSVRHLHHHIIPNTQIGDLDHEGKERKMLDDAEKEIIVKDVKAALSAEARQ